MKLLLTALCASFMIIPSAFSSECEKGKCDKEKKEEGTVLAACGKCKKDGDCDKDKEKAKEEGTLAHCGKCDKDGDKDKKKDEEEKKEGTLA